MPGDAFPDDWQICAVCGYALERWTHDGTQTWEHFSSEIDHPPVPVAVNETILSLKCDFCNTSDATDVVLCDSFPITEHDYSHGAWAACWQCADLVRRNRWSALVTRVLSLCPRSRRQPRQYLVQLYQKVQVHSHGMISQSEWRQRNGLRTE